MPRAPRRDPMVIERPPQSLIDRAMRLHKPVVLYLEVGDIIGTARFEGYLRTHSRRWHAQRGTGVGGSDVAAINGCSKYGSAYSFWAERTGLVERHDDGKNAAAKLWGQKLEKVVLERYAELHPHLVVMSWPENVGASFRHVERSYQLGNPDGLTFDPQTGEWGIVEVKTSRYDYEWKDYDLFIPVVPPYYGTQDQWYLDTFGFQTSDFAVLFAGSDYQSFHVPADPFEQKVNRDAVERMLELIETKTPPDWDGSDATYETVRRIHPLINKGEKVELADITGRDYLTKRLELEWAEAAMRVAKDQVMDEMGMAQHGVLDGVVIVARQATNGKNGPGTPFLKAKIEKAAGA